MKKEEIIYENKLKPGMVFENCRKAIEFVGYKHKNHTNQTLGWLSHYCNYTRNDDHTIIINDVFNPIKPFNQLEDHRYEINEIITVNTGKYIIIEKIKKNRKKYYKCKCLNDDYEFELEEKRVTFGLGCPLCGNRKRIAGVNTYDVLRPDLEKYFVDKEQLKTIKSHDYALCKCPNCGKEKEILMRNLVKSGFSCSYCSDGISYPNKFIREFLNQLKVEFIPEKTFEWSENRIYDEYLPRHSLIIENHGKQHYENLNNSYFPSLEYQQTNDWFKRGLAIQNNIINYVEIDCRESNLEWIKSSILNSKLPSLLDFKEEDIDWNKCDLFASGNDLIKQICEEWNKNKVQSVIVEKYKLDPHTVSNYLEIGAKCGYCNYNKKEYTNDAIKRVNDFHCKPIYCVELDLYFYSKNECGEYFKNIYNRFPAKSLYTYIKNNKKYNGLTFVYVTKEEFNNNKKESPNKCFGDYFCKESIFSEKENNNGKNK